MNSATEEPNLPDSEPITAPNPLSFKILGLETERAEALANQVGYLIGRLSRTIKLSNLDGVTIAADYDQALLERDRGYETEPPRDCRRP